MGTGTHDDRTPEEVRKAVENAVAQYELARFVDAIIQAEITLAVATAVATAVANEGKDD
ncbi:MAG: hypothetical protein OXH30_12675 [Chloroflexi bacterium]|nr:hypothetical protein [Chloroflexota bacterium]